MNILFALLNPSHNFVHMLYFARKIAENDVQSKNDCIECTIGTYLMGTDPVQYLIDVIA